MFNVGGGTSFYGSKTRKMINWGMYINSDGEILEHHWKQWRNAKGKVSGGLVNRRDKEWSWGGWSSFGKE
jgi:GH24 family phage-related lysozyme (muramidase)